MLSYLHQFHAGNFADVHKHGALTLALTMMQAKASPIAGFDTHAGSALYDLTGERAGKTGEAKAGIQRVWALRDQLEDSDWSPMLDELARLNPGGGPLVRYPGSPAWFSSVQRDQDTLTAFELHSTESSRLQHWARQHRVVVRNGDGLQGLLGVLPPKAPRLLVLIDPSYEIKTEYAQVCRILKQAWARCRHGVFLIWYPVLASGQHEVLPAQLESSGITKIWHSELHLQQPPERGMTGSGMLVVNPPWGFGDRLDAMLRPVLGSEGLNARHQQSWLVPE